MTTDLLARIPDLEREAQEYERKAHALRQIIEGVRALNGDASRLFPPPTPVVQSRTVVATRFPREDGPRGREAVRLIVSQRPGVWKLVDIKREVQRRGWPSSSAAIDTAVGRLQKDGEASWVKKGVYRFVVPALEASAPVSGDNSKGGS